MDSISNENIPNGYVFENIDNEFSEYIRKFIESSGEFIDCHFDDKIDAHQMINFMLGCKNDYQEKIREIYNRYSDFNISSKSFADLISENYREFYDLLKYTKMKEICNKIIKIKKSNHICVMRLI